MKDSKNSAAGLVNLLAAHFTCFDDSLKFERRSVRLLKRAQIFVADLWAAFKGLGYGSFNDIDKITIFAGMISWTDRSYGAIYIDSKCKDYRIPQILHGLGVFSYSPPLDSAVRRKQIIESGHSWEVQIRGELQIPASNDTTQWECEC